ncbi:hypothetical protein C6558_37895 [Ensifer sp. NM-2]|nr:hypothetical protein C6558_37895 [Ensifer sp. NM-2]
MIYYTGVPNVGDLANADIVSEFGGVPTVQASDLCLPHLLAIGSTLESAVENTIVWGTGAMEPEGMLGRPAVGNIFALRGKLTYAALRQAGLPLVDMPLGDPGYLIARMFGTSRRPPTYKVGLIAHYTDRHHPTVRAMRQNPEVRDLDVRCTDLRSFISEMMTCSTIVSSSLHGLIFAEALGIANLWVEFDTRRSHFKYRDWFSTTELPRSAPFRVKGGHDVDELYKRARLHESKINVDQLVESFPRHRSAELLTPWGETFVGHEQCRASAIPMFINLDAGLYSTTIARLNQLTRHVPITLILCNSAVLPPATVERLGIALPGIEFVQKKFDRGTLLKYFGNWAEPSRFLCLSGAPLISIDQLYFDLSSALDHNPYTTEARIRGPTFTLSLHRGGLFDVPSVPTILSGGVG